MQHEVAKDRARERWVADQLEQWFGASVIHTKTYSCADFLVFKEDENGTPLLKAVIEFKARSHPIDKYPDLQIDQRKVDHLLELSGLLHCKPMVVILWRESRTLGWVQPNLNHEIGTLTLNKPRDAGDVNDKVYKIPVSQFRTREL